MQKLKPLYTRLPEPLFNELFDIQLEAESKLKHRFSTKEEYIKFVFTYFTHAVKYDKLSLLDSHIMTSES